MNIFHMLLAGFAAFSIICTLAVIFLERKNPTASLAWVLVLLFLPVIGFILYIFLGAGFKINKRKKYMMKGISDEIYDTYIKKHLNLGHSRIFVDRHESTERLLTYLKEEGEGIFTDNNAAEIFIDGEKLFARMLDDLRNARSHIHILFYIFRNDELGREIVSILTEKARQGIKVRLIYDSVGTLMAFDTMFRGLSAAGGEVQAFSPIFSNINSHLRLNYRNHRKIVVIDGVIGYVGGMNVGVEYMGRDKRLSPWRDTHLRLTGSSVWFLQERFLMDWGYCSDIDPHKIDIATYFPPPIGKGDLGIQIISSGPDTFESPIKSGMLSMMYSARKNIYIQTPYFAPDDSFFEAMRIASRAKVDVRLMIPQKSDYLIVHCATMGYVRDALDCGVKVYLYNGFIHAKTIVVDGLVASIGTTNITNRSFVLDFEVNAFIYNSGFAQEYEDIFHMDEESCEQLASDYFSRKSLAARGCYNFARLLAPMM